MTPLRSDTPLLLALDTCSQAASLALVHPSGSQGSLAFETRRPAGETLPALRDLLDRAGCGPGDLDGIAVTTGPGSFTGVRVGLALAQGLARGLDLPVRGVPTLQAVAAAAQAWPPPWAVLQDARRNRVYAGLFGRGHPAPLPLGEPRDVEAAEFLAGLTWPVTLAGDGLQSYPEALEKAPRGSRRAPPEPCLALWVGRLALAGWGPEVASAPGDLEPCYLREADARLPGGKVP